MGLDMYITYDILLNKEDKENLSKIWETNLPLNKIKTITFNGIYWRKVNAIHKWFVENIQNYIDDCKKYNISLDKLKELLETIKKVNEDNSNAEKLLPTCNGFFYGSIDYDEYYFNDMARCEIDLIEFISHIEKLEKEGFDIFISYQSSW